MKLLHFYSNDKVYLGIKTKEGIINVEETVVSNQCKLPVTLDNILKISGNDKNFLKKYLDLKPVFVSEDNIKFAPSVTSPGKILCIGLNYFSHTNEVDFKQPDIPTLFSKFNDCLVGHNSLIRLPEEASKFDYEAELVIIMGKTAHNVSKEEALSYVFGYSIGNDFSARDLQLLTGQWLVGKACDDFAPLGPYIVTSDEINPDNLDIKCTVNGVIRQSSNTKNMIFNCSEIISYISKYITLKPGDIIYTGTPEGVILGHPTEKQNWLKSGDKIDITIENLGTLSNTLIKYQNSYSSI